jgi:hypothetical protein
MRKSRFDEEHILRLRTSFSPLLDRDSPVAGSRGWTMRRFAARGKAPRARTSPEVAQNRLCDAWALRFVSVRRLSVDHGTHLTGRVVVVRRSQSSC